MLIMTGNSLPSEAHSIGEKKAVCFGGIFPILDPKMDIQTRVMEVQQEGPRPSSLMYLPYGNHFSVWEGGLCYRNVLEMQMGEVPATSVKGNLPRTPASQHLIMTLGGRSMRWGGPGTCK